MKNVKIIAGDKDLSGVNNVATFLQAPDSRDCQLSFRAFYGSHGASAIVNLEELTQNNVSWTCGDYKLKGRVTEYSVESTKGDGLITCSVVVSGVSSTVTPKPIQVQKESSDKDDTVTESQVHSGSMRV